MIKCKYCRESNKMIEICDLKEYHKIVPLLLKTHLFSKNHA